MSKRVPTQADVQAQGRCGNGFNFGGPGGTPRYCGKPSEQGAPFGDCREHAAQFRETVRQIDQHGRLNESAQRIERGYRAVGAEHCENLPDGRAEVVRRGREAQERSQPRQRPRRVSEKQLEAIRDRARDNWNKALPKLAPETPRRGRRSR